MNELTELQNQAIKFKLNFKKELEEKIINILKNYFNDNISKISSYSNEYKINGIIVSFYVCNDFDISFTINKLRIILSDCKDIDLILELIDKKINKLLLENNILKEDKSDEFI